MNMSHPHCRSDTGDGAFLPGPVRPAEPRKAGSGQIGPDPTPSISQSKINEIVGDTEFDARWAHALVGADENRPVRGIVGTGATYPSRTRPDGRIWRDVQTIQQPAARGKLNDAVGLCLDLPEQATGLRDDEKSSI